MKRPEDGQRWRQHLHLSTPGACALLELVDKDAEVASQAYAIATREKGRPRALKGLAKRKGIELSSEEAQVLLKGFDALNGAGKTKPPPYGPGIQPYFT